MDFSDVVVVMLALNAAVYWRIDRQLTTATYAERRRMRRLRTGINRIFLCFFVGALSGAIVDAIFVHSPAIVGPEAAWVIGGVGAICIGAAAVNHYLRTLRPSNELRTIIAAFSIAALIGALTILFVGSPTLLDSLDAALAVFAATGLALLATCHFLLIERAANGLGA